MISYELAKQLKDAGFQFKLCNKGFFASDTHHWFRFDEYYYAPTLSEMIAACGIGFFDLSRNSFGWAVRGKGKNGWIYTDGSTPEEAVALLWLALNNAL